MARRPARPDISAMLAFAEAAPLSRAEIARRTGLSRSTVTMLANGERGRAPSYDTVTRLQALVATLPPRTTR